MENTTLIQIIEGAKKGFLEIKGDSNVPLNFAISDIRDISSRTGTYSKTIQLSGSKNNCELLNNYFDVNILEGTFDINKKTKVAIIQNGVVLVDNCFLSLLKVVKKQNQQNASDDEVYFEVQVKDELGDFFKEVGNKELFDLKGWDNFNHFFNKESIVNSFGHNFEDGYKYVLPWINDREYNIIEIMPAIYVRQIWDRIHEQNGFSYEFNEMTGDTIQFNKLLIPYAGDKKKVSEEYSESIKVTASGSGYTSINIQENGFSVPQTSKQNLTIADNIVDSKGWYDGYFYQNNLALFNPNNLVYDIRVKYKVYVENFLSPSKVTTASESQPNTYFNTGNGFQLSMNVLNGSTIKSTHYLTATPNVYTDGDSGLIGQDMMYFEGDSMLLKSRIAVEGGQTKQLCFGDNNIQIPVTDISLGDLLNLDFKIQGVNNNPENFWGYENGAKEVVRYKVEVESVEISIKPGITSGVVPGSDINLRDYLPKKFKQSDFLKAVYQMYNLFVEIDKNEPSKLIYTTRDKFYDNGKIKDYSKKVVKSLDQELIFLPELTTKEMILSYKDDDNDSMLSVYRGEIGETFGQITVGFKNENIKGSDRKEVLFSPTINVNTEFNAILPSLPFDFKMNPRILLDGGVEGCDWFKIKEYEGSELTNYSYPSTSMFNRSHNPDFSIEFAQSDYYGYNPGIITQSNLYLNHWRRTLAQIDSGKMLRVYLNLNEYDIQDLKLNDKIIIEGGNSTSIWYLNAVIDYNANSNEPTLVELLSVEDDLTLPKFGRNVKPGKPGIVLPATDTSVTTTGVVGPKKPNINTGIFNEALSKDIKKRIIGLTVLGSPIDLSTILGKGNNLPNGFKGVLIGDNINPKEDGLFFSDEENTTKLTKYKFETKQAIVDGVDVVEEIRQLANEISSPPIVIGSPIIDTNKIIDDLNNKIVTEDNDTLVYEDEEVVEEGILINENGVLTIVDNDTFIQGLNIPTDISQLTDNNNLLFSGNYEDLNNIPVDKYTETLNLIVGDNTITHNLNDEDIIVSLINSSGEFFYANKITVISLNQIKVNVVTAVSSVKIVIKK